MIELVTGESNRAVLGQLAAAGGGSVSSVTDPAALAGLYRGAAASLANQYRVTYETSSHGAVALGVRVTTPAGALEATTDVDLPAAAAGPHFSELQPGRRGERRRAGAGADRPHRRRRRHLPGAAAPDPGRPVGRPQESQGPGPARRAAERGQRAGHLPPGRPHDGGGRRLPGATQPAPHPRRRPRGGRHLVATGRVHRAGRHRHPGRRPRRPRPRRPARWHRPGRPGAAGRPARRRPSRRAAAGRSSPSCCPTPSSC